jgi:hypothetical protein
MLYPAELRAREDDYIPSIDLNHSARTLDLGRFRILACHCKMRDALNSRGSNMASRLSFRVNEKTRKLIAGLAHRRGLTTSEAVR